MSRRVHYAYLDGIRGLAALFVLLHHLRLAADPYERGSGLPAWLERGARMLDFGHYAVGVFIVLSGYCLMLPIADRGELRGGVGEYFRRRARRILPPYYAALGLTLALFAALPYLQVKNGSRFDVELPVFAPGVLLSHLFVVQEFRPHEWMTKIDPPMWSVAVEWHIYFLLPWVFLPLWRRIGLGPVVLALALGSVGLHFVTHGAADLVSPQYVALFAAGLWAAQNRWNGWRWIGAVLVPATVLLFCLFPNKLWDRSYLSDLLLGAATVAGILACRGGAPAWLQSRWAVGLGGISYSLYLVHFPVLRLLADPVAAWHLPPVENFAVMLALGLPCSFAVAWIFHRLFERPWLQVRPVPVYNQEGVPA